MKKLLLLLFSIIILPVSVNASDVYYCAEDASVGFDYKENLKSKIFNEDKFKIMIDFENKNVTSSDLFMDASAVPQSCFYNKSHSTLYCSNASGKGFSINKINLNFHTSKIYNRVDQIDDIFISYGTCEKF
jgi:hypothetical protein